MKTLILSCVSAGAILAATTASSFADQRSEGRWPNWYVGLHSALVFAGDVAIQDNAGASGFDSDTGVGYGASIGYRPAGAETPWRNLRFEVEWHQQRSDVGTVSFFPADFAGSGQVRADTVMVNMFYDATFRDPKLQRQSITPYFGAGFGWATLQLNNTETTLNNTADEDHVMAWQLMTGVSYAPELIPQTEWSLGYRYLNLGDADFGLNGGGTMEVDYDSHNIEIGAKFLF